MNPNDFDIKEFVHQHKDDSLDDLMKLMGTPEARGLSQHFADCLEAGIKIVEGAFDADEEKLIAENAMGGIMASVMASRPRNTYSVDAKDALVAISSDTIRTMLQLMMIYGIGLSAKEELR
jgi:hypothetical protein